MDSALATLQRSCTSQTKEINALLDANEEMVRLLSQKSAEWDTKLAHVEKSASA